MNDKIKAFAEVAGIDVTDAVKVFAELLIKDCCSMVNSHVQWNNPNDCLLVISIKESYGITPNE